MARSRLDKVVPVRVTRQDLVDLRRWARQDRANVSDVIRNLIDSRRRQGEAQEVAA